MRTYQRPCLQHQRQPQKQGSPPRHPRTESVPRQLLESAALGKIFLQWCGKGDITHISFVSYSRVSSLLPFKDLAVPVQHFKLQQCPDEERMVAVICSLGKTKFPGFGCIFHSSYFKFGKANYERMGGERQLLWLVVGCFFFFCKKVARPRK